MLIDNYRTIIFSLKYYGRHKLRCFIKFNFLKIFVRIVEGKKMPKLTLKASLYPTNPPLMFKKVKMIFLQKFQRYSWISYITNVWKKKKKKKTNVWKNNNIE